MRLTIPVIEEAYRESGAIPVVRAWAYTRSGIDGIPVTYACPMAAVILASNLTTVNGIQLFARLNLLIPCLMVVDLQESADYFTGFQRGIDGMDRDMLARLGPVSEEMLQGFSDGRTALLWITRERVKRWYDSDKGPALTDAIPQLAEPVLAGSA